MPCQIALYGTIHGTKGSDVGTGKKPMRSKMGGNCRGGKTKKKKRIDHRKSTRSGTHDEGAFYCEKTAPTGVGNRRQNTCYHTSLTLSGDH